MTDLGGGVGVHDTRDRSLAVYVQMTDCPPVEAMVEAFPCSAHREINLVNKQINLINTQTNQPN